MLAMECTLCRRRGPILTVDDGGLRLVCGWCNGPAEMIGAHLPDDDEDVRPPRERRRSGRRA